MRIKVLRINYEYFQNKVEENEDYLSKLNNIVKRLSVGDSFIEEVETLISLRNSILAEYDYNLYQKNIYERKIKEYEQQGSSKV